METIKAASHSVEDSAHAEEILHERSISNSLGLVRGFSMANLAIAAVMSNVAIGSKCAILAAMSTSEGVLVRNGEGEEASFTQL